MSTNRNHYLSEYTAQGFSREEAEGWFHAWVKGPEARRWRDAGFEPEEAHVWGVDGGFEPEEAPPWREALTMLMAHEAVGPHPEWSLWRAANAAAAHWRDAGFKPQEAGTWQTAGFSPKEAGAAARLRATGLGPDEAHAAYIQGV